MARFTFYQGADLDFAFVKPRLEDLQALAEELRLPAASVAEVPRMYALYTEALWQQLAEPIAGLLRADGSEDAAQRVIALTEGLAPEGLGQFPAVLAAISRTRAVYRQLGLDDAICTATMSLFAIFSGKYILKHGCPGVDRLVWFSHYLSGQVVRLGELVFEIRELPETLIQVPALAHVTTGDLTVFVHIGRGSRLNKETIEASLTQLDAFLAKFCLEPVAILSGTWLLEPRLLQFLPLESGIRAFARSFDLVAFSENKPEEYATWLFDQPENNIAPIEDWPTRTSLQRRARDYLMAGGRLGTAVGVLRRERG